MYYRTHCAINYFTIQYCDYDSKHKMDIKDGYIMKIIWYLFKSFAIGARFEHPQNHFENVYSN